MDQINYATIDDRNSSRQKKLSSIEMCEETELYSLEDAIKPVAQFVPDFQTMAKYVRRDIVSDSISDGLTYDQSGAIRLFTCNDLVYRVTFRDQFNKAYRSKSTEKDPRFRRWLRYFKLLCSALDQLPSFHGTVYLDDPCGIYTKCTNNEEFLWPNYTLCPLSAKCSPNSEFENKTQGFVSIECENGKDIRRYSYDDTTAEILLVPGYKFQVIRSSTAPSNVFTNRLKEITLEKTEMVNSPRETPNAPSPPTARSEKRVLVIGTTGVGKSSMINLLANGKVAPVSDNATGCTSQIQSYSIQHDNTQYEFIDTVGLNPSSGGPVDDRKSLSDLLNYIKKHDQGFHCVLFVTRKGRIGTMFHENYFIVVKCFIRKQIPIILVVTGCESDDTLDNWKKIPENLQVRTSFLIVFLPPSMLSQITFRQCDFQARRRTYE